MSKIFVTLGRNVEFTEYQEVEVECGNRSLGDSVDSAETDERRWESAGDETPTGDIYIIGVRDENGNDITDQIV